MQRPPIMVAHHQFRVFIYIYVLRMLITFYTTLYFLINSVSNKTPPCEFNLPCRENVYTLNLCIGMIVR